MKNYVLTLCFILFSMGINSQSLNRPNCSTNPLFTCIPDTNFEQALLNQNIDSDGQLNGEVPTSDINSIGYLDISNQNISDFTGIEEFVSLSLLYCSNNLATSLNLSGFNDLTYLDCSSNMLTTLNITGTSLENLFCQNNQLTALNLPGNPGGSLDLFLNCSNNLLTTLDLSNYLFVAELDCSYNMIQSLDLSSNEDTQKIIVNNNNLSELILYTDNDNNLFIFNSDFNATSNPNLCCIEVYDTAWSTANWTNIDPQTSFGTDCSMTFIPDANFEQSLINQNIDSDGTINGKVLTSDINSIGILDVSNQSISDLTGIEGFLNLNELDCSSNLIASLDLTGLYALEKIECQNNQLTTLTLPAITDSNSDLNLDCSNNNLTVLDLSSYLIVAEIDCSYNMIQSLDLSSNIDTDTILVNNNNLSELILHTANDNNLYILNSDFNASSNPNLFCIEVYDAAWSTTNWTNIDPQSSFSNDCSSFSYNCLTLEDANGFVGIQSDFDVVLNNTDVIKGFQFDITFPTGFVFNPNDIINTGLPSSFNISCSNISGNTYRVIGFSLVSDTIAIGNTAILTFPTLVGATVSAGSYTVPITDITLSDITNTDVATGCTIDGIVTVINSPPGDANGDQIVNILDILSTVDYIFGNPPSTFYFDLVDINEDEIINILDVLEIQDIILTPGSANIDSQNTASSASSNLVGDNYLVLNNDAFVTNSSETLYINLENDDTVKGAQFDFVLPSGFTFNTNDIITTSRLQGFTVSAQEIATDTYRVLIFSVTGATIAPGTGIALELPIFIESSTINSTYSIAFTEVIISDNSNSNIATTPPNVGEIIIDDTLNTEHLSNIKDQITIYPIPSENILNVDTKFQGFYIIYDIQGKTMTKGQIRSGKNEIIISAFNSGMYFIRVNNGNAITTQKIIKK